MTTAAPTATPSPIAADDRFALHELCEYATAALRTPIPAGGRLKADTDAEVRFVLHEIWNGTVGAINRLGDEDGPESLDVLTDLLGRVRLFEARVYDAQMARHAMRLKDVQRALTTLSTARDLGELHQRVAEELCTLGFDRGAVSTIDDGRWDYHTMFIEKDPALAQELVDIGQAHRPVIENRLVESDILSQGRTVLVYDVQNNPRVHKDLVRVSNCRSYAGAPVRVDGKIVGMLHGDIYYGDREVDEIDGAALGLFADGVGHAMARVALRNRLANVRAELDRLDELTPAPAPVAVATARPASAPIKELTDPLSRREVEVVELLASGATNRIIASRLCISEGTVKTHISHILRKIDVGNRAEAVAYWLRRQHAVD
ncbi:GAF domain-containing protein [Gordonia sp. X0973]|uniref:LuxR C-terminal-related transcriptional regulator n=1 Tax=Gordonia sp. X0973 TaxID=2742602 RepID=UPI000F54AD89|nr:LuxR C-terminal-related transcriptional regulator [Gordonia sp. X0973]QKT08826.1 GAF domain-containing protein [Gordonia sp. X0973]